MRESHGEHCGHSHDVPKLKEVLETVTEVVVRVSHGEYCGHTHNFLNVASGGKLSLKTRTFSPL